MYVRQSVRIASLGSYRIAHIRASRPGMHPQRDATRIAGWLFYRAKHPDGMQ
jgi:hypothetical protein